MFDRKMGSDFLYIPQNPKETILLRFYTYIEIFYVMIILYRTIFQQGVHINEHTNIYIKTYCWTWVITCFFNFEAIKILL